MRNLWNRTRRFRICLGLFLSLAGINSTVAAFPSNLDPTFGNLGKVVSSPDGSQVTLGMDMALQADGKIVMVGYRFQPPNYSPMVVARYNADGSLDTTFGNNGWTFATFGLDYEVAVAVDIQADGKIVVGGTVSTVIENRRVNDFAVLRFNPDGSPDTTFDGDGKVIIDFNDVSSSFHTEYLSTLKIASDGKIVVAGSTIDSVVDDRFVFARINPNGSLDTSFDGDGKVIDPPIASNRDRINDIVILSDGKIVVAGTLITNIGSFRIAMQYSAGGVKEWSYRAGMQTNGPNEREAFNGIAALPDGKFIVTGKSANRIIATRLNANGTEDNTFINPAGMPNGQALDVAVQADGKIIAGVAGNDFSLVRFNANGSLDTTFGVGGFVATDISGGVDSSVNVIIQPDGKYLVGGTSTLSSPTRYYMSMVRYLGTSAVTTKPQFDYDGDGKADISVFRPSENKWYILRSSDLTITQTIFALAGDVPVPSDYDGDGKTDIAIFRPSSGAWWYLSSISGQQVNVNFGASGDIPRPSDFDGDGKTDFVVYRPSNSVWYRMSATGQVAAPLAFGIAEDKPLIGDFDGDGKSDVAIFRPSSGDWWYASSVSGQFVAVHWGAQGDVPVPGDYDADGKTDFVVFRPSDGGWYILYSTASYTIATFGTVGDKPIAADYDGDGKTDVAVFRPSTGTWYLLQTTAGFGAAQFGNSADVPTENAFLP